MTNYVKLVNKVLVRMNEVVLDEAGSDFGTTRGPQELAKNAVNNSIRLILQEAQEWPFLKNTYVQTLTPEVREYDYPADWSSSDVDTFYLKYSSSLDNTPGALTPITFEEYTREHRALDDTGREGAPERIYQTYERKFGVSPTPDEAYEVEYVYWSFPEDLQLYNDHCVIPGRFDHVIVDGAMMFMMRFRSNDQSAAVHQQAFDEGIKSMRRVLFDDYTTLRSTVIPGRA
jgi:hypothetical protein